MCIFRRREVGRRALSHEEVVLVDALIDDTALRLAGAYVVDVPDVARAIGGRSRQLGAGAALVLPCALVGHPVLDDGVEVGATGLSSQWGRSFRLAVDSPRNGWRVHQPAPFRTRDVDDESVTRRSALALALFMLVAGSAHFAFAETYRRIVPTFVGHAALLVRWSGLAEIACAGLLVNPRTRRLGARSTAAVLVAVFPANIKMALDGGIPGQPFPFGSPVVAWARLPLQLPLIMWALRVARRDEPVRPRPGGCQCPTARAGDRRP